MFIPSCRKSDFPKDQFSITDIQISNCLSVKEEIINLRTTDKYYLNFSNSNANFNCSPGQIIVGASLKNDTIIISEYETEHNANCICRHLVSGKIGPLNYGTYIIVVLQNGNERFKQGFDFYEITDINIKPE